VRRPGYRPAFGIVAAIVVCCLLGASVAVAEVVQHGTLRLSVDGNLSPKTLPRTGTVPVSVKVGGRVSTTDGSEPPQLQKLTIEINRHGRIDGTGLPTCRAQAIQTASNGRALAVCGPALVGEGKFTGTISLPGTAPFPFEGKLLLFNAIEHGRPALLGHIYSPHPFATSFVIAFQVRSEHHGEYGTVLTANLKQALGSKKNLTGIEMTLSRRYTYQGRARSYVSAGCPAPKGFPSANYPLARTSFGFAGGTTLTTVLNRNCGARG
jgi:hypothetical protein